MSLYNKYRPLGWDSVIGQDGIVETLKNAVASNRVVSTYLFCGPRGTGKTTCARIFAKALNCEKPIAPGIPCCECETCKDIASDQTSFVTEIDSASNTGVENMRDIKQNANLAGGGNWKIYILDECHMLSKAAQNAALKMFEESPEKVIFVLCTTELNKVEGTIISRSLRFDFRPITIDNIIQRLKYICGQENFQVEDAALKMIAKAANGGMRDSISILERVSLENNNIINVANVVRSLGVAPVEIVARLGEVLSGNHKAAFEIVGNIIDNGYDIYQFLQSSVDYLRDVLLLKIGLNNLVIVDSETLVSMQATAANIGNDRVSDAIKILEETMNKYKYTDNKRILVEVAFYKMASGPAVGVVNNTVQAAPQVINNVVEQVNPSMVEQMVRAVLNGIDFSRYMPVAPAYQNAPMPVEQPQVQMPQAQPTVQVVQPNQQMYQNLTQEQWHKYLEILEVHCQDDVTPHSILTTYSRPLGWEASTFVVEIPKEFEFYAQIMNEQYAILCARVLSQCMNASVFFKAITIENNRAEHNQQGYTGAENRNESVPSSAPISENLGQNQEQNAFYGQNTGAPVNAPVQQYTAPQQGVTQSNSQVPIEMSNMYQGMSHNISIAYENAVNQQQQLNNNSQASANQGVIQIYSPDTNPPWEPPVIAPTQMGWGNQSAPSHEIYNNSNNLSNSYNEVPQVNNTDPNAPVSADMLHGVFGFGNAPKQ